MRQSSLPKRVAVTHINLPKETEVRCLWDDEMIDRDRCAVRSAMTGKNQKCTDCPSEYRSKIVHKVDRPDRARSNSDIVEERMVRELGGGRPHRIGGEEGAPTRNPRAGEGAYSPEDYFRVADRLAAMKDALQNVENMTQEALAALMKEPRHVVQRALHLTTLHPNVRPHVLRKKINKKRIGVSLATKIAQFPKSFQLIVLNWYGEGLLNAEDMGFLLNGLETRKVRAGKIGLLWPSGFDDEGKVS